MEDLGGANIERRSIIAINVTPLARKRSTVAPDALRPQLDDLGPTII